MTKRLEKYLKEHLQLHKSCITDKQVNVWVENNILSTTYNKEENDEEDLEEFKIYKDLLKFLGGKIHG